MTQFNFIAAREDEWNKMCAIYNELVLDRGSYLPIDHDPEQHPFRIKLLDEVEQTANVIDTKFGYFDPSTNRYASFYLISFNRQMRDCCNCSNMLGSMMKTLKSELQYADTQREKNLYISQSILIVQMQESLRFRIRQLLEESFKHYLLSSGFFTPIGFTSTYLITRYQFHILRLGNSFPSLKYLLWKLRNSYEQNMSWAIDAVCSGNLSGEQITLHKYFHRIANTLERTWWIYVLILIRGLRHLIF